MAEQPGSSEQHSLFALEDASALADLAGRVSEVRTVARRTGGPHEAADEALLEERSRPARPDVDGAAGPSGPADGDGDVGADALTIAQFYERVRGALETEFREEVWIAGEIRSLRESRGHRFLELADVGSPTGRGVAPQLEVACWARQWPRIARELAAAGVDLEVGRVVRVRGQVSVWDGAGKLRFTLTALDVAALLGGIAAARRRLLLALEAEDLLEANRRLAMPPVPLRIGLVTSAGSEGHHDFVGQLERSGFAFSVQLASSLVQGPDAPAQLVRALRSLERYEIDLGVVVRGGGGRGDLASFDTEEVARAIALASFPVWTGIGHTGDRAVADEVAHRAWITPTACGEAVVGVVAEYWLAIERRAELLQRLARARLEAATHLLERQRSGLARGAGHRLELARERVGASANVLARALEHRLGEAAGANERCRQVLRAYDPTRQLERGWSLTRDESGRLVRSVAQLRVGAGLATRVADGEIASVVQATTERRGDERV